MSVAAHQRHAADAAIVDKIENLTTLVPVARPIIVAQERVSARRPVHGYVLGEILEIDAPVERRHRIAPDLPWRLGRRQPTNEPRLLGRAKHRLWRCVLSWVSELRARERNGRRWIASVHRAAGIENLRDLLGNDGRELPRLKGSRVWFLAQWLGAKAPVVSEYELDIPPPLHCPVSR